MPIADGIEGGPGPDTILNDGFLSASAISSVTATGGASVVWGGASAELAAAANAVARGVGSGRDDDILINRGTVVADALAYPSTSNDVGTNGFLIFRAGVNTASSSAAGSSNATAVDLGLGSNTLVNQGSLHAIAGGVAGANSIAASSILPLSAPAHAQSLATFNTLSATGVTGGDGNNLVLNESDLNVTAGGVSFVLDDGALVVWPGTDALASARADGDGAWSGWGTAIATARADNAVARGIYLSGGDNVVRNSDSITVIANPIADAHAVADADGISFSIPNATATTLTSANNALAVGIELGHGDNEVLNENCIAARDGSRR